MCTLIVGRDVIGPGSVIVAANRDEDPARPSLPPGLLLSEPRVIGGRDRVAGGTWLAVRGRERVVAMLNRRLPERPPVAGRSRGLLALDVAAADAPRDRVRAALEASSYAPFTLVVLAPADAWLVAWDGVVRGQEIDPGWHVLTHADLDDPGEPRTARLRAELAGWIPETEAAAEAGLIARLAAHDPPAVCIHDGRMATVSFAVVTLGREHARYLHGEGRPCERVAEDYTGLLGPAPTRESSP